MRGILRMSFKYIVFFIFTIIMCYFIYENTTPIEKDPSKLNLKGIDNLMIVAHPDDETIWGGAHLLEDNYLVVCITCGPNKTRVEELKKALNISNDKYLMLGYPDKTNGKKDNWDTSKEGITKDLTKIITYKNWKNIVTHNEDGEYGHIHHKLSHKIVKSIYEKEKIQGKLYFFGKYYKKTDIDLYKDTLTPISESSKNIKVNQMIDVYKSQSFITSMFGHMFPYENWQEY